MAINYEYDVSTVDTFPTKNSKSDVVHKIHWKILATDDANNDANGNPQTATVYGSQSLDTSDLSSFKDFADLKSSDVQGWLEKALGEEKISYKNDRISMEWIKKTIDFLTGTERKKVRARDKDGKFVGDDESTPDVDEAYTEVRVKKEKK